ncbi:hypothetical protein HQN89_10760 [Paenibacillus frigoriresistens]|uniref:hypothetical protein n=1 Tax=Paenibacillus alginolyticus TaxID=59839 RepID=UPI00156603E4|nr:hypothetical protein [Paenibacillus frigoriresistens]NRF91500.1 hypothetical protein [Paenibacillus frigoriresistens]
MKTNVTAKIKDLKFGVKEDQITLTIDGNITDEQVSILRKIKKTGVAFVGFSSSQMDFEDEDEFDGPRKGLQVVTNASGVVESVTDLNEEGEQLAIDDVVTEEEAYEEIDEETEETDVENEDEVETEEDKALEETEQEEQDPEDPDKPLTFDKDLPF